MSRSRDVKMGENARTRSFFHLARVSFFTFIVSMVLLRVNTRVFFLPSGLEKRKEKAQL